MKKLTDDQKLELLVKQIADPATAQSEKDKLKDDLANFFRDKIQPAPTIIFKGLPLICHKNKPCYDLLPKAVGIIAVSWEGYAQRIIMQSPLDKIDSDWFNPSDKGAAGAFAFDKLGQIIFAITKYEENCDDDVVKGPHYFMFQCNVAYPWAE